MTTSQSSQINMFIEEGTWCQPPFGPVDELAHTHKEGDRVLADWGCGSVGRGLAWRAQGPGFDPQHCVNWVWCCMPVIQVLRRFRSSRPSGATQGTGSRLETLAQEERIK